MDNDDSKIYLDIGIRKKQLKIMSMMGLFTKQQLLQEIVIYSTSGQYIPACTITQSCDENLEHLNELDQQTTDIRGEYTATTIDDPGYETETNHIINPETNYIISGETNSMTINPQPNSFVGDYIKNNIQTRIKSQISDQLNSEIEKVKKECMFCCTIM